jgi:hypothetical protein
MNVWTPPSVLTWQLPLPWWSITPPGYFDEYSMQTITVGSVLSRLKDKFEGGRSFAVNWYEILGEASDTMVEKVNPRTLKRTLPLFGGIIQDMEVYLCPDDISSFSGIYDLPLSTTANNKFSYVKPEEYNNKNNSDRIDIFTDIYVNGIRFLLIKHDVKSQYVEIDPYSTVGTKTGALTVNTYNTFDSGSLDWLCTTGQSVISDNFATPQDYSAYLQTGDAMLRVYVPDETLVTDLTVKLMTDSSNFFVYSTSNYGIILTRGWNYLRFPLRAYSGTGAPNMATINSYQIIVTSNNTIVLTLEDLMLKTSQLRFLEYFTKYAFRDAITYDYKDTPSSDNDLVFLERNESNILMYEAADIVIQNATYDAIESNESKRIMERKKEWYGNYDVNTGSTQVVPTHSRMPVV